MNKRIRELREKEGLTRAAFGESLGVSSDVINNLERGRVDAKDSIIKLICSEYDVREEWLRTGKEPMRNTPETFSLDKYAKERGATELELRVAKAYFSLDPEIRKMLLEHFKAELAADNDHPKDGDSHPKSSEELESQYKVEDAG